MNDKTKILGIFYIIFGAMGILVLPLFYLQKQLMNGVLADISQIGDDAGVVLDYARYLVDIMMPILLVLTIAHIVFNILVGIFFIKHKAYHVCLITSIFTCLVFPLGTILGIFALITLVDKDIKKLFYVKT